MDLGGARVNMTEIHYCEILKELIKESENGGLEGQPALHSKFQAKVPKHNSPGRLSRPKSPGQGKDLSVSTLCDWLRRSTSCELVQRNKGVKGPALDLCYLALPYPLTDCFLNSLFPAPPKAVGKRGMNQTVGWPQGAGS